MEICCFPVFSELDYKEVAEDSPDYEEYEE